MDAINAMMTRRSVRRFKPQAVSDELLETMLRAAMQAPSAVNEQPWHFLVMDDRELLDGMMNIHPFAKCLKEAPMAVLVCADLTLEKAPGFALQDCCAATENLLLAAHALGLGAVWLGIYAGRRMKVIRQMLSLEEHIVPYALVAVGHPADMPAPQDRYKPERVHKNSW
jgi:nitroreductase